MSNVEQKLSKMLEIQNELNKVVHPEWQNQNYNWEDACMVEAVELFDHLNWKWWKKYKAAPDYEQVKLEAIDIWHFILSRVLEDFNTETGISTLSASFEGLDEDVSIDVDWEAVKSTTRYFLEDIMFDNGDPIKSLNYIDSFVNLLVALGITVDDLYVTYVAKVELNRLRWANGYGTTYIKTWDDQEDNVWLANYVKTLDSNDESFVDQVRAGLELKYKQVKQDAVEIA
jgi:dimeric dUTPase (all-alpha-NTP-PPase superfamily)